MQLSLDLLRTFLTVHREGSLTGAARQLGLSQPTVTAQIKALEAAVGRPLFTRLARGVEPTGAADDLARRIAEPLDQLAAAAWPQPSLTADPFAQVVHLGGPAEFTTMRVLPALSDLVARGLQLRVTLAAADELLDGLLGRTLDLIVTTVRPRHRGVDAQPLYDEEFVLVASPTWSRRLPAEVIDRDGARAFRDVPLISYAEELPIIRRYWRTVFEARPVQSAALVVPDLRGVLAAAVAGAGVTVLPRYLCAEDVERGRLMVLHAPAFAPLNTLFLATRTSAQAHPTVTILRHHLLRQGQLW